MRFPLQSASQLPVLDLKAVIRMTRMAVKVGAIRPGETDILEAAKLRQDPAALIALNCTLLVPSEDAFLWQVQSLRG